MTDIPPPFDEAWFRLIVGFIVGLCLGSFITMLSYRLPRHMSIVTPGSHCPSCGAALKIRDLVPLVSWLAMRGRCGHCGAKIGVRYVLIELTTGGVCAIACAIIGIQWYLAVALIGIITAITSATIYLERDK
jgi:leader peptidase (prepilin peptidase)/N-methyltransferase